MTPVDIINLGLSKIGQGQINSVDPPKSNNEKTAAKFYPHWRKNELQKRRWIFNTERIELARTALEPIDGVAQSFEFVLPATVLRVIRTKSSRWVIRGRKLYSPYETQTVEVLVDKSEDDFDPSFTEVLAARCAKELVEPITESNEKWQKANASYKEAISEAGRLNAFQLEEHTLTANDEDTSWIASRTDPMSILDSDGD